MTFTKFRVFGRDGVRLKAPKTIVVGCDFGANEVMDKLLDHSYIFTTTKHEKEPRRSKIQKQEAEAFLYSIMRV